MAKRRYFYIAIVLAVFTIVAALWFFMREKKAEGVFEANGQVRGDEVTVSTKLPGRIEKLFVNEGQTVEAGDIMGKISFEEVAARLEQARADAQSAKNRLKETEAAIGSINSSIEQAMVNVEFAKEDSFHRIHLAKASIERVEAEIMNAESQLNLAKRDYERYSELLKGGIASQRRFEEAEAAYNSAQAGLNAAVKARDEAVAAFERAQASTLEVSAKEKEYKRLVDERRKTEASYETLKSQLQSAEARVREVEAAFRDTDIRAPSTGTVINKLVEEGEVVGAGAPLAAIVNLSAIYIKVYIPEKDIGRIRIGNPARIYGDAFPERYFEGKVTEVSQKAEFTPKEVHMKEERTKLVFGVKVKIENPEGYLKPGMPADVFIKWKEGAQW